MWGHKLQTTVPNENCTHTDFWFPSLQDAPQQGDNTTFCYGASRNTNSTPNANALDQTADDYIVRIPWNPWLCILLSITQFTRKQTRLIYKLISWHFMIIICLLFTAISHFFRYYNNKFAICSQIHKKLLWKVKIQ